MEVLLSIVLLLVGIVAIVGVIFWTLRQEPEEKPVELTREQAYIAALKRIYDRRFDG